MTDVLNKGLRTAGDRARGLAGVFQGFKDFISRGNAIELAVGVVIGAAFGAVVSAIQEGIISPLIAAIAGEESIADLWTYGLGKSAHISFGLVADALLKFLITAAIVYFLIVLPLNKLAERRKRGVEEEPTRPSEDILLLQEIRDLLSAQTSAALHQDTNLSSGSGAHAAPGTPDAPPSTGRPPIA
ncbi:MAG TPA: large conductance mechanosensitive channel protein MscL [Cellulomonas sp.]